MAQVGRISGGLLQENLLRKGVTAGADQNITFSNIHPSTGGTPLLHLNVIDGRIGLHNDTPSSNSVLHVTGTTRITNDNTFEIDGSTSKVVTGHGVMTVDTNSDIAFLNLQNSTIQPFGGTSNIILNSAGVITSTNLQTEELNIDNNVISTLNSNSNLELRPNGTGTTEVVTNLNVSGNLHSYSDITADGNITFGNSLNDDRVIITADIQSDVIPDVNEVYTLGSVSKRWSTIETVRLNGALITSNAANIGGVDVNLRQGKIWYVATNGDNTNVGDHQQGPFRTIDYAVTQASAGDTIYVYPGVYEESCPIEIPAGVTLHGHNQRNTIIEPASSQSTTDIFLLNGETALTNFTIRNFYYDNLNDIGYAFRFAPGGKVTSRSPYIQNITVRTTGSTVTASDPLGFNSGDAGKGILVDGAVLASDTREASMLFHAITLITPGVDAVTMTNGVRVEWLNSFTYFANRGIYAANGTGRTDDNSVVRFGAEMRSIGSANIYGNQGVVADGADVLIYLVMHNFSYIGTGLDSSNDSTLVIQENETIELNNGKVHYQSQSQSGDFRVGDNFLIDFEKGDQSFNINDIPVVGVDTITVTTGTDVSYLDLQYVQTGNVRLIDNSLASINGDLNISSASGLINLDGNVTIEKDLDVSGNVTIAGALIGLGNNQSLDVITFESGIDTSLLPKTTDLHDIGNISQRWDDVWLTQVINNNVNITNNFIETTQSNSDLELRANGTGKILLSDNVVFENSLTNTLGLTTLQGTLTALQTTLNNGFTQIGNLSLDGNFVISNKLSTGALAQFENILVNGNTISTTLSNSNLELRAIGTGEILISSNDVIVSNNTTVTNTITTGSLISNTDISAEVLTNNDLSILDNNITALTGNLEISAAGDVVVDTNNLQLDNNLEVIGLTTINNDVTIVGILDHTGNRIQAGDLDITGNLTVSGTTELSSELQFENILINDNFLTTTQTNSDLELRASGLSEVILQETANIQQNLTVRDVSVNDVNADNITTATLNAATITIAGNKVLSNIGNLTLTGYAADAVDAVKIIIPSNDFVAQQNLSVVGLTTRLKQTSIVGSITQTGNRSQVGNYDITGDNTVIGNLTLSKKLIVDEVDIDDNFITTNTLNQNLDLRASGTGEVIVPNNNVTVQQNLGINNSSQLDTVILTSTGNAEQFITSQLIVSDNTVQTTSGSLLLNANGTGQIFVPSNDVQIDNELTVNGTSNLLSTNISGTVTHTGNRTQTGNYNVLGDITVTDTLTVPNIEFENIDFDENVITTIDSNSDLELRAAGTGIVRVNDNLVVTNDVTISGSTSTQSVSNINQIESNTFSTTDLLVDDNNILVTTLDTDLALSSTGNILINSDLAKFNQTLDVDGVTSLSNINIVGTFTTIGDLTRTGNTTITGNVDFNGKLIVDRQVEIEDILLDDNIITTTQSNADLDLRAAGTGIISVPTNDLQVDQALTVSVSTTTSGINNSVNIDSNIFETSEVELLNNVISNTVTNNTLYIRADGIVNVVPAAIIEQDVVSNFNTSDLLDTEINGLLTLSGNQTQTGDYDLIGSLDTGTSIDVSSTATISDFRISGNRIATNTNNTNFILAASNAGIVSVPSNLVNINQDLTVIGSITSQSGISNIANLSASEFNTSRLRIYDNNIDATGTNTDIILEANSLGKVLVDSNDVRIDQNLNITGSTDLAVTNINGDITHTGFRDSQGGLDLLTGEMKVSTDLTAALAYLNNIQILQNSIITQDVNASLILTSNGTGNVVFDKGFTLNSPNNNITVSGTVRTATINNNFTTQSNAFETADLSITGNIIESISTGTDVQLSSTSGNVVTDNNVQLQQDLLVAGIATTSDVDVTGSITQTGNWTLTDFTTTGNLTVTGNIIAAEVQFEEININDNVIDTTSSNAYLELRANGTGEVLFDAHTRIQQNLYINGVTDITDLTVDSTIQANKFETDTVEIYDNRIQTTISDADLELRASGTGSIDLEDVNVNTNIVSSTQDITFSVDGSIVIHGNNATQLPAGNTVQKTINTSGDIRFNTDDSVFEGFTTVPVSFAGIYSSDRQTSVTANTASNELRLSASGSRAATISTDNFNINGIILPNIDINNSSIEGTLTNTDLTIANGTGLTNVEGITFNGTTIINNLNTPLIFENSGRGYTKLDTTTGVSLPSGPTTEQTSVELGDTRWNTDTQLLETYDGNTYIASAGLTNNITPQEFDDLLLEYTLIFG